MSTEQRKSLVTKLAEVMAAVERVPKNGHNKFHDYDYATEADIAAAIRTELASRAVMLVPAILNEQRHPVGEKGSVLTVLEMEMEFLDGESGESMKKPWRGYGTDKEDKGGYKAMTGGEKYFLLKTFLMPTGDDPEADEKPNGQQKAQPKSVAKPDGYDKWIADMQSVADEGRDRLNKEWKTQPERFRLHLTHNDVSTYNAMRERAKKADEKKAAAA